ncbi:uncharacterized protein LOC131693430 [Topomyia yanbarensis]|uniref:uncharacterized protein LOC131693430 n=1 Tax=Topomyia yanbarensis TaxID=2498891 RepID=UPI00273A9472|nr:uncharacterized protein LOC131693430 [Topomyia yanbarensis]
MVGSIRLGLRTACFAGKEDEHYHVENNWPMITFTGKMLIQQGYKMIFFIIVSMCIKSLILSIVTCENAEHHFTGRYLTLASTRSKKVYDLVSSGTYCKRKNIAHLKLSFHCSRETNFNRAQCSHSGIKLGKLPTYRSLDDT